MHTDRQWMGRSARTRGAQRPREHSERHPALQGASARASQGQGLTEGCQGCLEATKVSQGLPVVL